MADKVYPLSAREFEVVRLLADGLTNDELAATLNLSRHTISSHIQSIYTKLKVRNRVEAARWFWRGRVATMVANGRH
jgi:DNA-binding CsgD family transcriptional regulator